MKKIFTVLIAVLLGAVLVWAASLYHYEEVQTCSDTDGGINYLGANSTGTISGLNLTGSPYSFTDKCSGNNVSVFEGSCYYNSTSNKTYGVVWKQDCTTLNLTCQNGACV